MRPGFKLQSLTDRNGCLVNGTDAMNVERGFTTTKPEDPSSEGEGGRREPFGLHWLSELLLVPWIGVLASLILISAVISFLTPYFLTLNNILGTVALYFSWICITGFGAGLVMIGGGLDLSVGSVMALAGMICALILNAGYDLWLALLSGVLVGIAVGLANGLMVTLIGLSPFIATLATLSMVRGLTYGIVQGELITPPTLAGHATVLRARKRQSLADTRARDSYGRAGAGAHGDPERDAFRSTNLRDRRQRSRGPLARAQSRPDSRSFST